MSEEEEIEKIKMQLTQYQTQIKVLIHNHKVSYISVKIFNTNVYNIIFR